MVHAADPVLFVGIDIAATTFTGASTTNGTTITPAMTWNQTPDGFTQLQQQLTTSHVTPAQTLVVLEATSS